MKKLKIRFKRALYAFFKDEIFKELNLGRSINMVPPLVVSSAVEVLEYRILLEHDYTDFDRFKRHCIDERIRNVKEQLIEEAMKYCVVDNDFLLESSISHHKYIRVRLAVNKMNRK